MRILITGGSSFTGMWFVKALSNLGHDLVIPLKRDLSEYQGIRKQRIEEIELYGDRHFNCPFGSESFLSLIENSAPFDLFCNHAADVADYRNPNFDFADALAKNTHNLSQVLDKLKIKGCNHVILTGSVFERGEGAGSEGLEALSPYGLSKGLTYETFRFFTSKKRMHLGKFVVPNPFGPYEEDRFTTYLMREWLSGNMAVVKTPEYVRDNVPAPLLAHAYVDYAERFFKNPSLERCSPSFYRETMREFAARYACETKKRIGKPCTLDFLPQEHFEEPKIRVNKTQLDPVKFFFDEERFFDENVAWYKKVFQ